jgi:hypothetical protein
MAATGFRTMHVPRVSAVAGPDYGGAVLALYTYVGVGERALGVLTCWFCSPRCGHCRLWPARRRSGWSRSRPSARSPARSSGGSVTTARTPCRCLSPPGHGLVYLIGLPVARIVGERRIVWAAAVGSVGWGPAAATARCRRRPGRGGTRRRPVANARAAYASVFVVVAALELYGTSIGA